MTPEQWNGLVALMRAIAHEAIAVTGTGPQVMEAKRHTGACASNVRKLFVDVEMSTRPFPKWVEYVGSWQADHYMVRLRSDGHGWDAVIKLPDCVYELVIDEQIDNLERAKQICRVCHDGLDRLFPRTS